MPGDGERDWSGDHVGIQPFHAAKGMPAYIKKCLFHKDVHASHLITQIVQFAEIARGDEVLAAGEFGEDVGGPVPEEGVALLAIDGADPRGD